MVEWIVTLIKFVVTPLLFAYTLGEIYVIVQCVNVLITDNSMFSNGGVDYVFKHFRKRYYTKMFKMNVLIMYLIFTSVLILDVVWHLDVVWRLVAERFF